MTTLKLIFDHQETKKIDVLKQEFGIKTNTELVRLLIALRYKELVEKGRGKTATHI
jgi:hypothetical protein